MEHTLAIRQDYMAHYTSAFSPTGSFTLIARQSGDGQTLMLSDIIPMQDNVIASQRHIHVSDMSVRFVAGPYLAWGSEFVVTLASSGAQSWTRIPLDGGDPQRFTGPLVNGGFYSDMFSPFLAALMPRPAGDSFRAPAAYPRADQTVSVEWDSYTVLGRETLTLSDGLGCECWIIEKSGWDGFTEHIWVDRQAPYVFRRVRDPGGPRQFASDLMAFQVLDER